MERLHPIVIPDEDRKKLRQGDAAADRHARHSREAPAHADDRWADELHALSPAVLLWLDPGTDFSVSSITANARRVIGHESEQVMGDREFWSRHLHPDDLGAFLGLLSSLQPGATGRGKFRLSTNRGAVRWIQAEFRRIEMPAQDFRIAGALVDATGQSRARTALRRYRTRAVQAERLLTDTVDSLSETFVVFDAAGRFVTCNRSFRKAFPFLTDLLIPGTSYGRILRRAIDSGEMLADPDPERWIADRLAPSRDHAVRQSRLRDGRHLRVAHHRTGSGGFVIIANDITEAKRQEQALRERTRQLVEAQRIARLGDWRWDLEGTAVECSDGIRRIFGLPRDAAGLAFDDFMARVHAEDRRMLADCLDRCRRERSSERYEFRILRDDGVRHLWGQVDCELDEHGEVVALFGVCQDITGRKETEASLILAGRQAEAAHLAKSQFLAVMSHELRTPLNAVIGFAELIAHGTVGTIDPERCREYAEYIRESGTALLRIVDDILDLSRIDATKYTLRIEPVTLGEVIAECLRMLSPRAAGISVEIDGSVHGLPAVAGDRKAIRQIVINLLSNAVKFTPAGGLVRCEGGVSGDHLHLSISDTGIGIAAEDLDRLGRPFEQGEAALSRRHGGIGIGLALSRSLAELHGGSLEIVSAAGQGTTARVTLPIRHHPTMP